MLITREKLKNFAKEGRASSVSIFLAVLVVLFAIVQFAGGRDVKQQKNPSLVATEFNYTSSLSGDTRRSCTPVVGENEEDVARNEILKSLRKLVISVSGQKVCE